MTSDAYLIFLPTAPTWFLTVGTADTCHIFLQMDCAPCFGLTGSAKEWVNNRTTVCNGRRIRDTCYVWGIIPCFLSIFYGREEYCLNFIQPQKYENIHSWCRHTQFYIHQPDANISAGTQDTFCNGFKLSSGAYVSECSASLSKACKMQYHCLS